MSDPKSADRAKARSHFDKLRSDHQSIFGGRMVDVRSRYPDHSDCPVCLAAKDESEGLIFPGEAARIVYNFMHGAGYGQHHYAYSHYTLPSIFPTVSPASVPGTVAPAPAPAPVPVPVTAPAPAPICASEKVEVVMCSKQSGLCEFKPASILTCSGAESRPMVFADDDGTGTGSGDSQVVMPLIVRRRTITTTSLVPQRPSGSRFTRTARIEPEPEHGGYAPNYI